ncbi:MAG: 3-dehydroquinate synthase [Alphaproteobacteria bacterium RIFOXYD12_FULL_60_8]|nr:MAG: 3-dehydroquinate synthase [Alphaproteobacteria bacterium RIFOXYD12_FULL_60_8]
MSERIVIQSHKGPYEAVFATDALERLNAEIPQGAHFLIDAKVADLYAAQMGNILSSPSVLRIEAREENKSLDKFPAYVDHLVSRKIRRDHTLIAIGGGIVQDITCFLAATLLRGVEWRFLPTTLLAQCDSCIGSKSSINSGTAKNILGTFTPPKRVDISTIFLATLEERDVRSGVGEMLKVMTIDGPESFNAIARDYDRLFTETSVMERAIRDCLMVKKRFIEVDEFDQGPRAIFNYGHSFGHAIEAATDFAVPHGIAVTIGMDLANWISSQLGVGAQEHFARMHPTLKANYRGFEATPVPLDPFLAALSKDKKNVGAGTAALILPNKIGRVFKDNYPVDAYFGALCETFLSKERCA